MDDLDLDAIVERNRHLAGHPAAIEARTTLALVAEVRRLREALAAAHRLTFNHDLTPEELEQIRQRWRELNGTGGTGAVRCVAIVKRYVPSLGQQCKRMTRNSSGLCEKHRPSM